MAHLWQTLRELMRFLDSGAPVARAEQQATCKRGNELLERYLSPAQREQYERHNYFDVIGGTSGRRYRIRYGKQMNVELFDKDGRRVQLLCFVPAGKLPVGDVMLTQKFALELFEPEALKIARKSLMWDYVFEEEMHRRRLRF